MNSSYSEFWLKTGGAFLTPRSFWSRMRKDNDEGATIMHAEVYLIKIGYKLWRRNRTCSGQLASCLQIQQARISISRH